jgi:hypothetical protein
MKLDIIPLLLRIAPDGIELSCAKLTVITHE